jgi:hypothetical protein
MTKLVDLKKRLMANPVVRHEYAAADAEFSVLEALVQARAHSSLASQPPWRQPHRCRHTEESGGKLRKSGCG